MSSCQSSLVLSVKELVIQQEGHSTETSPIICSLHLNSRFLSIYSVKQLQDSIFIPHIMLEDVIQLLFFRNEHKQVFGSIKFALNDILQDGENTATQWIAYSDEIKQDISNPNTNHDALTGIKVLVSLEVKEDVNDLRGPICKKKSFEDYLKHRNQYGDHAIFSEGQSFQLPQAEFSQKTQEVSSLQNDNFEALSFHPVSRNSVDHTLNCEVIHNLGSSEQSKAGTFLGLPSQNTLNKEIEIIQGTETQASISSLTYDKQITYLAELREPECLKPAAKTVQEELDSHGQLTILKSHNDKLEEEVTQLKTLLQRSENENKQERLLIQKQINKFTILQEDLDRVRKSNTNYESVIHKMEQALEEMETQLNEAQNSRLTLIQENHDLAFSLQEKQQSCCEFVEQINTLSHSNLTLQKDIQLQITQTNDLEIENSNLAQQASILSSQVQNDEKIILDLQQEVFTLREKEVETLMIKDVLEESLEKIKYYEYSLASLAEICNLNNTSNDLIVNALKTYINDSQKTINEKTKQIEEMKSFIDDLTLKVSFHGSRRSDNSTLKLEGDLINQLKILENDRDFLKEELSNANENYFKLTQKYIELSDTLEKLQKNTQYPQASQPTLTPKLTALHNHQKPITSNEGLDEIEAKLIEFLIYYKLEPSILTKIEKGVYLYNEKKVYIKVCNGHLIVKVGDSHKPLQEFLKVKSCTSPLARTLYSLVRNNKKAEKSVGHRSKLMSPNRCGTQFTDSSQRDLSFDLVSSRSFLKESSRNTIRPHVGLSLEDQSKQNSAVKPRTSGNLKLRQILSSKSVEKKLSSNSYQSK